MGRKHKQHQKNRDSIRDTIRNASIILQPTMVVTNQDNRDNVIRENSSRHYPNIIRRDKMDEEQDKKISIEEEINFKKAFDQTKNVIDQAIKQNKKNTKKIILAVILIGLLFFCLGVLAGYTIGIDIAKNFYEPLLLNQSNLYINFA